MYLLVNDIKEKACTVSLDFCADLKLAKQTEFLKLQCARACSRLRVCVCVCGEGGGGAATLEHLI
jgi:hypothetical protein